VCHRTKHSGAEKRSPSRRSGRDGQGKRSCLNDNAGQWTTRHRKAGETIRHDRLSLCDGHRRPFTFVRKAKDANESVEKDASDGWVGKLTAYPIQSVCLPRNVKSRRDASASAKCEKCPAHHLGGRSLLGRFSEVRPGTQDRRGAAGG
jgi:hypothetical protein